ncbi:4'-phosphopantetheinyl transferase superfamily protein [Kineococcus sp. TBRC 1896]|uniref:4'-phosphopantetheinyl transferase superfamily protein n=1 Tax=Kineococcus mangrovi TaxID=1660183 RepID=A0ABV4I862_9ACTN
MFHRQVPGAETGVSLLVHGPLPAHARTVRPTADERRRADRLRRSDDRDRSLVAAHLLRVAAARLAGIDAAEVVVTRACRTCGADGDHGRPVVRRGPAAGVALSASHAGDVVVVAASTAGPVGVDVDLVAHADFPGFDDVALGPREREVLDLVPPTGRPRWRARCWTRKEAVLKWTGLGLAAGPTAVEVPTDGAPRGRGPLATELPPDLVVVGLAGLPPGYVGAVAAHRDVAGALARPVEGTGG